MARVSTARVRSSRLSPLSAVMRPPRQLPDLLERASSAFTSRSRVSRSAWDRLAASVAAATASRLDRLSSSASAE
jgi:hypothetical protein